MKPAEEPVVTTTRSGSDIEPVPVAIGLRNALAKRLHAQRFGIAEGGPPRQGEQYETSAEATHRKKKNIFMAIGLAGLVLLCTRWTRLASWLIVTSLVLLAIAGYSPLANLLLLPLEDRFPQWDASRGPPDGIVCLEA